MAAILMAAWWEGGGEKVEESELRGGGSERAVKAPPDQERDRHNMGSLAARREAKGQASICYYMK